MASFTTTMMPAPSVLACSSRLLVRPQSIVSKHQDDAYKAGPSRYWIKVKNPNSAAMLRAEDGNWSRPTKNHDGDGALRVQQPAMEVDLDQPAVVCAQKPGIEDIKVHAGRIVHGRGQCQALDFDPDIAGGVAIVGQSSDVIEDRATPVDDLDI